MNCPICHSGMEDLEIMNRMVYLCHNVGCQMIAWRPDEKIAMLKGQGEYIPFEIS